MREYLQNASQADMTSHCPLHGHRPQLRRFIISTCSLRFVTLDTEYIQSSMQLNPLRPSIRKLLRRLSALAAFDLLASRRCYLATQSRLWIPDV